MCKDFLAVPLFLLSAVIAQMAVSQHEQMPDPLQFFEPREYVGDAGEVRGKSLKYRLLKPQDFDPQQRYPLVLFLHGAGERGDDNQAQLQHGMAEFCRADRRRDFPCYVVAPQCPTDEKWADVDWTADSVELPAKASDSLQLTLQLLDQMLKEAAVDQRRIYITGLSMGGYGTWDALVRRPELFAAAIPICGGGDPQTASTIKSIPIACFHGDADQAVAVDKSREMIAALRAAGGEPLYTEYAGVDHDSWTQTYAQEQTFQWLFSQRKRASSAPAAAESGDGR